MVDVVDAMIVSGPTLREAAPSTSRLSSTSSGTPSKTIPASNSATPLWLAGTTETFLIGLVMFVGPVEEKHYTDATVMAAYWYFIVISWVALYGIVFAAPRFL